MILPERRNLSKRFNRHEAEQSCNFFLDGMSVTIQTSDDKKQEKSLARTIHGTFAEIYNELVELTSRGAGVFLMVNGGDGLGRQVDNVLSIRAFFLDLDGAPMEPVMNAAILPNIVVASSP
jgi:hypothetical protein